MFSSIDVKRQTFFSRSRHGAIRFPLHLTLIPTISWFCVVNVISGADRMKCEDKRVKLLLIFSFQRRREELQIGSVWNMPYQRFSLLLKKNIC